ncbi:MAG: 4Fe-4S binding protein [Candidatus Bathyarchaeota archaeon]|nr:4Fe-4S binding protein [Candidatus Bathyarchaeota archaeon]
MLRNIVKIDEEKCTGCGLCIPACAEGALKIVNGKARLVKDIYCDGLGACLGECPQDAITLIQREAEEFNEKAAAEYLKKSQITPSVHHAHQHSFSCPSAQVRQIERASEEKPIPLEKRETKLTTWPVQLKLLPPNAPFFENADLLITADCVPFAYADFHEDLLSGKTLAIGCPKLDDAIFYQDKLAQIFRTSNIKSITVVNMEVPCCFGLYRLVKDALAASGKTIPLKQETISIKGEKIS